jgi:RNA polymerase sigma-70 factor (ECF subfamily)
VTAEKAIDQALVERVQQGDKQAFNVLVLKYQQKVANVLIRYIRDPDEVLDVTQEAFVKAYRALPGFRGESAFYTWLYRIAINTAKNYLTARKRRPPQDDIEATTAEQMEMGGELKEYATPEQLAMQDDTLKALSVVLDELPTDLRMALTLRELQGLSYTEIAEAMGCPIGTVRSRIFRAREALTAVL